MRNKTLLWFLTVAALCFGSAAALARPLKISNTGVTLDAPAMFLPASDFQGISWKNAEGLMLASVHVSVTQEGFDTTRPRFTAPAFERQGLRIVQGTTNLPLEGRSALWFEALQQAQGMLFRKQLLIFGNATQTVVIVGTISDAATPEQKMLIGSIVKSVRWTPQETPLLRRPEPVPPGNPGTRTNEASESCVSAWTRAHRKNVGPDAVVAADQIQEWETWCSEGKRP